MQLFREVSAFSNYNSTIAYSNAEDSQDSLSGRVLVLNQSYEPLMICSPKRALVLLFLYKAELIKKVKGRKVRSVNSTFDFPSVIKLNEYKHIPYKRVELSRKNILRRDNGTCQYCGTKAGPLTIDHILPRSRGGEDSWENLVTACFSCNNKKGNRTPKEARMPLINIPSKPHYVIYLNQKLGRIEEEWRPFVFC